MFSFKTTPFLVLALVNLTIAGFIYLKDRKSLVNKLFAFYICSFVIWVFSMFMLNLASEKTISLLWGRAPFCAASILMLAFLYFVEVFPDRRIFVFRKGLVGFTFLAIIFTLLSYSPLIVVQVQRTEQGNIYPVFGMAYVPFGLYILSSLGYGFFILAGKWRKSKGLNKLQIQYLFLGIFLFLFGAATTNLIIPALFHIIQLSFYGPYFTLFFVGFTAHAIIRYRLMNIKAVISKGMVYFLSSVIAVGILVGLFLSIRRVLPVDIIMSREALVITAALSGIIVFFPLRFLFQFLLDKYFYREYIDLQRAMRDTSQALTSVLKADELFDFLGRMIVQRMKVESISLFLRGEEEGGFHRRFVRRHFNNEVDIPETISTERSVVLQEIGRRIKLKIPSSGKGTSVSEKFLVREELSRQTEDDIAQSISEELASLHCDVAFPLALEDELIGVLFVGPKLSADPYFQSDLDMLSTVSNQAAIAIKNAQLYAEVNWMKEYNENILRNMESGVITVDNAGTVITFNEGAERLTGLHGWQIIGRDATALGPELSTLILAALHSHELSQHSETMFKTQDNLSIPIVFSTSLLRDKDGKILGGLMVFDDLSQIKGMEEEKRRMERLATAGSLASWTAHEIKNLLFPISTFMELSPEEVEPEFTALALKQIGKIRNLSDQLEHWSSPVAPQLTSVKIDAPIENVLETLSFQIEKRKVQVIKDYAKEIPAIFADEFRLEQLFLNILKNSIEAMPTGGTLSIKTYTQMPWNGSNYVCVDFSDTGIGIDEESLSKIFNPFFTTKEDGTGVGLTICKSIVDEHKGDIQIKNNETGEGVTTTIRFPVRREIILEDA